MPRRSTKKAACAVWIFLVLGGVAMPNPGASQIKPFERPTLGLGLRGGMFMPTASGPLFSLLRQELTLDAADLRGGSIGAEVLADWNGRLQLVLGLETSSAQSGSQARTGSPASDIRQTTTFDLGSTVHGGIRFFIFKLADSRGLSPGGGSFGNVYVGLGGGRKSYELRQRGQFPDEMAGLTFDGAFAADGSVGYAFGSIGTEFSIPVGFSLGAEVRYEGGEGTPDRDFSAFDSIDLGGVRWSLSVVRYW